MIKNLQNNRKVKWKKSFHRLYEDEIYTPENNLIEEDIKNDFRHFDKGPVTPKKLEEWWNYLYEYGDETDVEDFNKNRDDYYNQSYQNAKILFFNPLESSDNFEQTKISKIDVELVKKYIPERTPYVISDNERRKMIISIIKEIKENEVKKIRKLRKIKIKEDRLKRRIVKKMDRDIKTPWKEYKKDGNSVFLKASYSSNLEYEEYEELIEFYYICIPAIKLATTITIIKHNDILKKMDSLEYNLVDDEIVWQLIIDIDIKLNKEFL